uniref:HTH psq-type domain-containing protein n=1 Tax=Meloidogyne javanica TaxID=6303 RepID=A0A915LHW5_MELJA
MPRKAIAEDLKEKVFNDYGKLTIKKASEKYKISTGSVWNIYNKFVPSDKILKNLTPKSPLIILNPPLVLLNSPIASRTRQNNTGEALIVEPNLSPSFEDYGEALIVEPVDEIFLDWTKLFDGIAQNSIDIIDNLGAHQNDVVEHETDVIVLIYYELKIAKSLKFKH